MTALGTAYRGLRSRVLITSMPFSLTADTLLYRKLIYLAASQLWEYCRAILRYSRACRVSAGGVCGLRYTTVHCSSLYPRIPRVWRQIPRNSHVTIAMEVVGLRRLGRLDHACLSYRDFPSQ